MKGGERGEGEMQLLHLQSLRQFYFRFIIRSLECKILHILVHHLLR